MILIDWIVIGAFFLVILAIGLWSAGKNKNSRDFFVASGKMPWWLAGISHHVSGYSGAVFVAYAGIAYTHGFTIYVWWALTIAIALFTGATLIVPYWNRLRRYYDIQSPLEYLAVRYNLPAQQLMAWSGVILKLFDVGAKWAAIAILLREFTGLPLSYGILISGGISLIYITAGGLWAVILTDFAQFIVQVVAGLIMFVVALTRLGGISSIWEMWDQLPPANNDLFHAPYDVFFALTFLIINFLSYNGGTWNLATRFISAGDSRSARRSAYLSGILYLVWPLILFFPMWAAPIFYPDLADPNTSYAVMTQELLPNGLIGLVLASLFANTLTMTSSDANTIASVITRDILPSLSAKFKQLSESGSLRLARITTVAFTLMTIIVALQAESFGGVLGLIISWFAALLGPIAVPMLLGLLPWYKHCDAKAAIITIIIGFSMFVLTRYGFEVGQAGQIGLPVLSSLLFYTGYALASRGKKVKDEVEAMMEALKHE